MTNGPAKAAIMPPMPIQTIKATFMSMRIHASAVQMTITTTVAQRLISSSWRSRSSSVAFGAMYCANVRR